MILIKHLALYFKIGQQITIDKKVVADFPENSYWEIKGRNNGAKTVRLKNVQWGQEIVLSFECYAFLLSNFENDSVWILQTKNVPKVIHLKAN